MSDTAKNTNQCVLQKNFSIKFRTPFDYLDFLQIHYRVINHPVTRTLEQAAHICNVPRNQLLRLAILQENGKLYMTILPHDRFLDLSMVCKSLKREFVPASPEEIKTLFESCESHSYPPLPKYFNIESILDVSVLELEEVYFEVGNRHSLVKMKCADYLQLLSNIGEGDFSESIASVITPDPKEIFLNFEITEKNTGKKKIFEHIELPIMPPMVDMLLHLKDDLESNAVDLISVVEQDPVLCAQLIHCAQYLNEGTKKITSVEGVVMNVLGYDLTLNLALGLTINDSIKVPLIGPLGLKVYWQFSIYSALLVDLLIAEISTYKMPNRGLACLSAFLHNFGHLVLADLFPSQYYLINRYLSINPHANIINLEMRTLGVCHTQMGAWLLKSWGLPQEVITAARWHHEEDYADEHAIYSNLVFIATRLLKRYHLGDANSDQIPLAILEVLGLTEHTINRALDHLMMKKTILDLTVEQLLLDGS